MKSTILSNTVNKFKNFLSEEVLIQLSHKARLFQRSTGKLNPLAFTLVMVVEMSLIGTHSLNTMCQLMVSYGGLPMTPQALSQRLGKESTVSFLKLVYSRIFQQQLSLINFQPQYEGILGCFNNVYLEDSSLCALHEKVAASYKGNGGGASKAGYKIHTIWNGCKNCIEMLHITPSSVSDQSQSYNIINHLKPGDLVLRDLGYFSIPCFRQIANAEAYFLSRLKSDVKVYTVEGSLIEDLGQYIERRIGNANVMELEVLVGKKERFPLRLIAGKVSQRAYDQRIRKLRRKKRTTLSKSVRRFNQYTFFITNISSKILESEKMATLYKFRWEIELLFKSFKSGFQIDVIKGESKNRVECFILSKLISIMVTTALFSYISLFTFTHYKRELSFFKFVRWVLALRYLLLLFRPGKMKYNVMQMKEVNILSLCKQKRSRKTSRELLEQEASFSDIYPQSHELEPLREIA